MAPVSCPQYQPPITDVKKREVAPCVIVMVGEPIRERTCLAHSLRRYLTWTQHQAKVFSVCESRKTSLEGSYCPRGQFITSERTDLWDRPTNQAMHEAKAWLLSQHTNSFAILDGNKSTEALRHSVHSFFEQIRIKVLFVEFVKSNVEGRNIIDILNLHEGYARMGLNNEDIKTILESSVQYRSFGSPCDKVFSFIKYINQGEDIVAHKLQGLYQSKILNFVANFKPLPQTIYFSRHGESEYNLIGRIGGDAVLTERGQAYAKALAKYFNQENRLSDLEVWTSRKIRTKQTASLLQAPKKHLAALDEIDAGICEGLTYEEVAEMHPKEMAKRDLDKLRYRYPHGESYTDVMQRLEPALFDIQCSENPLLVISHQAVLRPVLAYFCPPDNLDEIPYINVPLHTLIKVTPKENEWSIEFIKFNIDCVNTYRKQPQNCSIDRSNEEALSTVPAHLDSIR